MGIVDTLAKGDVLKYDDICDLNILICFNKLSYDKSVKNSYTNTVLTSGLNLMNI